MSRTKDTENFPVGSWLVAAPLRPIVHAYYKFAREADDISDDPAMPSDEKLRRLDAMDAQLQGGEGEGSAANVRRVLEREGLLGDGHSSTAAQAAADKGAPAARPGQNIIIHCRDLLVAFKRDSVKPRTRDWADLMDYCRFSASPVGRFLLDLHGESRDTWGPGDALCNALQVLNHLQDCQDDFVLLDRVYLPQDMLTAAGADVEDLRLSKSTPALRSVMIQMLDHTRQLVEYSKQLPPMVKDGGLRRETSIIIAVAERLLALLYRQDPLAQRVELSKAAFAGAVITGLARTVFPWGNK